jgi:hypothetical protein
MKWNLKQYMKQEISLKKKNANEETNRTLLKSLIEQGKTSTE